MAAAGAQVAQQVPPELSPGSSGQSQEEGSSASEESTEARLGGHPARLILSAGVGAAAALLAAFLGLSSFLRLQWEVEPYFSGELLLALTAWMYLAPLAAVLALMAVLAAVKSPVGTAATCHPCAAALVPLLALAACLALAAWALHQAIGVLRCGVLLCVGDQGGARSAYADGMRGAYGLGVLAVAAGLASAVSAALLRAAVGRRPAASWQALPPSLGGRRAAHARRLRRLTAAGALALLVLPFCLLLTAVLPNSLDKFHVTGIAAQAALEVNSPGTRAAEYPDAWMRTLNWRWSPDVVLKLYPDTLMFYAFLELLALAALASAAHPRLGRLLGRSLPGGLGRLLPSLSLGELLAGGALFALLALWSVYWLHDHAYHGGKPGIDDSACDRVARYFGLTSTLFMSLALLPAAKNSLWLTALGASWERTVWVHRGLGMATLVTAVCHVVAFWVRFDQLELFPHDVLALVTYYPLNGPKPPAPNSDNWTIPLMQLVGYPALLCLGLPPLFRRRNWELFKYLHFAFLALVPTTLLHGTNAWQFLLGGVAFWLVDAGVRFVATTDSTPLVSVAAHAAEGGITELRFEKRCAEPGQYCFIQVPAVSALEWHPFSLCSSPLDGAAQMCIKSMGPGSFTARLHELAKQRAKEQGGGQGEGGLGFVMNVDGPYGRPLELQGYAGVLLLAGGIGITAMHSVFRALSQLAARGELPAALRVVRLVWAARTPELFGVLGDSLRECLQLAAQQDAVRIDAVLYLSGPAEQAAAAAAPTLPAGVQLRRGRPEAGELYDAVLADCPGKARVLARACGPEPMVLAAAQAASGRPRVVFEPELFSF